MKRVLITGGSGFIGQHLVNRMLADGFEVTVFDALLDFSADPDPSGSCIIEKRAAAVSTVTTFVKGDIRDRQHLDRVLADTCPDIVIHLAGIPLSRTANRQSENAVSININGTANLLEAVRSVDSVKRFVFISSSFVYGDFSYFPADELHPLNPIDMYGATKLSGEMLTRAFGARFGVDYSIVRPSAVYGTGDTNGRVVQKMVENALSGKPITMHNSGASMLDFTYVDDTVAGIVLAATHPNASGQAFNITRGEGRSIRELVALLQNHFPALEVIDCGQDEIRPERGCLDIVKARTLLNYVPVYSLEAGIARYVESLASIDRSCC